MQKLCGFVQQGNKTVTVGGLSSASLFMQNYPLGTVTVYAAGTLTLSTIYSDNGVTAKANPFTASATGFWEFYAADGRYDVKFNGGTGTLSAYTISDYLLDDSSQLVATIDAMSFSATPTFDASDSGAFTMTLTANVTSSTISGMASGQRCIFSLTQDATGGRTFAWPASFTRPPVIASGANQRTTVEFIYDGTNWRQVAATGDVLMARNINDVRGAGQFDGATTALKVTAAATDIGGAQGIIGVPSSAASGDISSSLISGVTVIDNRGTGAMNGDTYTTNNTKGFSLLQRDTATNNSNKTFSVVNLYHKIYAGGQNISGNKSNWISAMLNTDSNQPGQVHALSAIAYGRSMGDLFALVGTVESSGGNESGIGDEGKWPLRAVWRQSSAVFTATVDSIASNVITYSGESNEKYVGVGLFLINTSANVYSTGTATTVASSATITEGGGADWEAATVSGVLDGSGNPRFGFSLDFDAGNPNNNASSATLKHVTPITAVAVGGTTATLRNAWPGRVTGSTTTYKIYKGSVVTAVNPDNNTITVSDATQFTAGDTIELPLDNRFTAGGLFISSTQQIGATGLGRGGLTFSNGSSTARAVWDNTIVMTGHSNKLFEQNGQTIAAAYFYHSNTGPCPATIIGLSDNADTPNIKMIDLARKASVGGAAGFDYSNSRGEWRFYGSTGGTDALNINSTVNRVGVGVQTINSYGLHVVPAATEGGIKVNGNTTGDVLDCQVASSSKFKVAGNGNVSVADADELLVNSVIVPQEIEVSAHAQAATAMVDQTFFVATQAYQVTKIRFIHAVAETTAGTLAIQVTKDDGTEAPGAGDDLLTNNANAGFDGKATANTAQTGTLTATTAFLQLAAGNRLSLDFSAAATELVGVTVTITLKRI